MPKYPLARLNRGSPTFPRSGNDYERRALARFAAQPGARDFLASNGSDVKALNRLATAWNLLPRNTKNYLSSLQKIAGQQRKSLEAAPVAESTKAWMKWSAEIKDQVKDTKQLGNSGKEMGQKLNAGLRQAFGGVFELQAGIFGLVASASPVALDTFTGSLKLFAASLGQLLIPLVVKGAYYLQLWAHQLESMDPQTKAQIRSWLAWGAGIMAGAAALKIVLPLLSGIMSVTRGVISAVQGVSSAMSTWTSGAIGRVGALTAAVAALAVGLSHTAALMAREESHKQSVERLRAGGAMTTSDFAGDELTTRLGGTTSKASQIAIAKKAVAERMAAAKQAADEFNSQNFFSRGVQRDTNAGAYKRAYQTEKEAMVAQRILQELEGTEKTFQQIRAQASGGGFDFKTAAQKMQPAITSIEDARKKAQLAALGGDPLERERMRVAVEGNRVAEGTRQEIIGLRQDMGRRQGPFVQEG